MSSTSPDTIPDHPAKASKAVRDFGARLLLDEALARPHERLLVLDPFAGVGRMFDPWEPWDNACGMPRDVAAAIDRIEFHGVELEPEWAAADQRIEVGNALALNIEDGQFDVLWTSPCYGNRMADHHDAQERCSTCAARGFVVEQPDPAAMPCPKCGGTGANTWERNTYRHKLGRELSPDSAAILQWGRDYRRFHELTWLEADRVLADGALALVNMKNHYRKNELQRVSEFHLNAWLMMGYTVEQVVRVETPGNRNGANRDLRDDHEIIMCLRKHR